MRPRVVGLVVVAILGVAVLKNHGRASTRLSGPAGRAPGSASDLRSRGATVQIGEAASEPFFSAAGRLLLVNGLEVRVFGFETSKAATAAAAAVSSDGYSIGANEGGTTTVSQIEWVDTPHFYRRGSLIVLYLGKDSATLKLLDALIGRQFAGDA
jgi:hypothetical protein